MIDSADAAARIQARAGQGGVGIDMIWPFELPLFLPGDSVQAINAVVAGAEVRPAVADAWAGLDVSVGHKMPQFLAGRRIQAIQLANEIGMHAFADIDSAIRQAWAGVHMLHLPLIVEAPNELSGQRIETVNRPPVGKCRVVDCSDVDAIAGGDR